jgi:hypothetical protein
MKYCVIKTFLLTLFLSLTTVFANAQENVEAKIVEYLKDAKNINISSEHFFTGKFIALPEQLKERLERHFPKHRFLIAEMNSCGHLPCRPDSFLFITDAQSGEVVTAMRSFYSSFTTKSFPSLFNVYQATDKTDLEEKLHTIGEAIVFTSNNNSVAIGNFQMKKRTAKLELKWGEIFRVLHAKFDKNLRIKSIDFLDGRNGKKLSF